MSKAGLSQGGGHGDVGDRAERCPGLRKQQAQRSGTVTRVRPGPGGFSSPSNSEKGLGCPGHSPSVSQPLCATAPLCHSPSLPRTGVVSGDAGGAAEDLPEEGGILLPVLDEDILQGLCPVQLVEDDRG